MLQKADRILLCTWSSKLNLRSTITGSCHTSTCLHESKPGHAPRRQGPQPHRRQHHRPEGRAAAPPALLAPAYDTGGRARVAGHGARDARYTKCYAYDVCIAWYTVPTACAPDVCGASEKNTRVRHQVCWNPLARACARLSQPTYCCVGIAGVRVSLLNEVHTTPGSTRRQHSHPRKMSDRRQTHGCRA